MGLVSAQLRALLFPISLNSSPDGEFSARLTERASGKKVIRLKSRVMVCSSYCETIGMVGPVPKS